MTHIDTAEMYGDAEAIVAAAVADCREEVFLVSKVVPGKRYAPGRRAGLCASLQRLRTDRLDCYLLHWRVSTARGDDRGLRGSAPGGKILSWGVSKFDVEDLDRRPGHRGAGPDRLQSGPLHTERAGHRARRAALVREARRRHGGLLALRQRRLPRSASAGGRVLAGIAQNHGTTPYAVALAYLTRLPGTFTIPKTGRPDRAVENAGAADLHLGAAEIALIDAHFPRGPRPRMLPML